ncbi:MAG: hypothetical protein WC249_04260 [Patescibacteria group bacterium]
MKKTISISLVVALVFFVFGYFVGGLQVAGPNGQSVPGQSLIPGGNTYQAGYDAAKKRLADSGFVPMMNFEVKNVSGKVTAVKNKAITLKIRPLEPLADPSLDVRTVTVDANTKIYISEQKDQALYQKEMADFNKKMQAQIKNMPKPGETPTASITPSAPIMPPEPMVKKEASLTDIKVGAMINIVAVDKDIKNSGTFVAAEITLQSSPVGTPSATPAPVVPPAPIK